MNTSQPSPRPSWVTRNAVPLTVTLLQVLAMAAGGWIYGRLIVVALVAMDASRAARQLSGPGS